MGGMVLETNITKIIEAYRDEQARNLTTAKHSAKWKVVSSFDCGGRNIVIRYASDHNRKIVPVFCMFLLNIYKTNRNHT